MGGEVVLWTDSLVLELSMVVPPIGEVVVDEGLGTIGEYITFRHNSGAWYIATRPISDLAVVEETRPGSPATM